MRYVALGGGSEVGASCNYIEIDGRGLLVDAGIRVGSHDTGTKVDSLPDLAAIQDLGGIDAVLVTHAHLDHIGALPLVHQAFPAAPIYATAPTVHLMRVLLADAIKLMAMKAEQEMECPLYGADLVARMFTRVVPVPMGGSINITDTVRAYFFPAGHILGAAMVGLEGEEGRALVTGDVSAGGQRTIPGMVLPRFKPHLLVIESTYGNRLHANRQREEKGLAEAVAEVVAGGGHALIPAFALGRSQEVVLLLQAYQQANRIPKFPIWVDGMVRSICDTYVNFPECLQGPVKRVINNGGNPFYREKATARPVTVAPMREKVLAGAPSCIVASSGMLTGGPSQFYASRLLGDEKNAILLCGYQDEESPGHKLLELTEQIGGEISLENKVLQVRCRVDKYGLSAHADAGELAALVEHLRPRRVVLVHGDHGARAALAQALGSRHAVHVPENGEELTFTFRRARNTPDKNDDSRNKPGASPGGLGAGRPLVLKELWAKLVQGRSRATHMYTAEELAALWYGPGAAAEQQELTRKMLTEDSRYFAPDWKHPYFYRPRRPDLVAVEKQREELMAGRNRLPGHLILVRDAAGAVRAGICFAVNTRGFEAWKVGQEGTNHPAESLLEVIGKWQFAMDDPVSSQEKPRLHNLIQRVKPLYRQLKPGQLWEKLKEKAPGQFRVEEALRVLDLGNSVEERLALAWRLNNHPEFFERRLEGFEGVYTVKEHNPGVGNELPDEELVDRIEQNAALALVDETFDHDSGLYRKGIEREEGRLVLYFKFPEPALEKYKHELERLVAATGWEIALHPEAHHGALSDLARDLLPTGWNLPKNPAIHRELKQVALKCSIPEGAGDSDFSDVARRYKELTGYKLVLAGVGKKENVAPVILAPRSPRERMEINRAYGVIRAGLEAAGAVIYRTSKKTGPGGEFIEVQFISPQTGARYQTQLENLAGETGWDIRINPEPNQNEIKALVRTSLPAQWGLKKEPGFFKDRQEVRVKLAAPPPEDDPEWSKLTAEIFELTGYRVLQG